MPQENNAPRRKRRRRRRTASITALYIVAVLGLSVLLAALTWIAANDILALNKPEHSATVVLPEEYFTIRTKTDKDGNVTTTYKAKVGKVASLLKENDLIEFKSLFRLFSGATDGEKKLRPNDCPGRGEVAAIVAAFAERYR